MGINGLTTFIQTNSKYCMERFELHDTNVVLDGNSIAAQLYVSHCKSNDCFGGDYDKYAHCVTTFFQLLATCNVTPYVVLDGGYERKKLVTIYDRLKNKVRSAYRLNCVSEGAVALFPLCMNDTFKDVALSLNINMVQCDFEADSHTANIARTLKCPVISLDSDYYIFDAQYIPFSTLHLNVHQKQKAGYKYIPCRIYKAEKFLQSYNLKQEHLPILAVLLGNDYVKRTVFNAFYRQLKILKSNGQQSDQQKRIKSLINWLRHETLESTILKVLSRYKNFKRKRVARSIQTAIEGYTVFDSMLLKYLNVECAVEQSSPVIDVHELEQRIEDDAEHVKESDDEEDKTESNEDDTEANDDEQPSISEEVDKSDQLILDEAESVAIQEESKCATKTITELVPDIFFENYRKCLYPTYFMDLLTLHMYYCAPQMENYKLDNSHTHSFGIVAAMHKILTDNSPRKLVCLGRHQLCSVKKFEVPDCELELPNLHAVQTMSITARQHLLCKILDINPSFCEDILRAFPSDFTLLLITFKYLVSKNVLSVINVYALILNALVLGFVDKKLEYCRASKAFTRRHSSKLAVLLSDANRKKYDDYKFSNLRDCLKAIDHNDALLCFKDMVEYFQMDYKMKSNYRLFDENIPHVYSEFQSVFYNIKNLNKLLNLPFCNCVLANFYDGTFVYNITANFAKRRDLDSYVKILLQDAPIIVHAFEFMSSKMKEWLFDNQDARNNNAKRRRKKRKAKVSVQRYEQYQEDVDTSFEYDPNNKFSLLTNSVYSC